MLRNLACRLLSVQEPRLAMPLIVATVELCIARFPYCRSILLGFVNTKLERLDTEKISMDDFTDADSLYDAIKKRLREYALDKILRTRHASREQIAETIESAAARIYYSSLLATLDILGIECPLYPEQHPS